VYYDPDGPCFFVYEGPGPDGKYFRRKVTFDEWRPMGFDTHSKCANPLFVDRASHDYRLKPDSPALGLGFQQIDTSQIGLKEDFPYKEGGRFSMQTKARMTETSSVETANIERQPACLSLEVK